MTNQHQHHRKVSAWLISLLIAALAAGCGGGSGDGGSDRTANLQPGSVISNGGVPASVLAEAGAPQQTGDMATV